ncbi:MAG: glycosyltransferase [bacterium]|nr:glycosyltransferase [bacterium]
MSKLYSKALWLSVIVLFLLSVYSSLVLAQQQSNYVVSDSVTLIAKKTNKDFSLPPIAKEAVDDNLAWPNINHPDSERKQWTDWLLYYLFLGMALCGVLPVITFFIEHNLAGLHAFSNHFKKCKDYFPRVAVIIPAWNEALVLKHTLDILLKIDYPLSMLRLYVIDDGSTDETPEIMKKMQEDYPQNIYHVRKEAGGKGKAHAVNYGLSVILSDDWAEALLFIDADISFKKDALRRLTRHLADPDVGAVTGYIKVGNRSTNYITRSIGYEYIVSQAIARRAQNVLGVVACLAGGTQLHTRANIEALGGYINTSTLAEDTYTTFATQKLGKKVIYEGNSFVYAEEPKTLIDVWKQRFRWARGNIQITKAFKQVWFRSGRSTLGSYLFGIIWFCVVLTPVIMILSAIGLVGLFILNKDNSSHIFFYLTSISLFVYLYTTFFALIVDRRTSRLSWLEGFVYPGVISLLILFISINPALFFKFMNYLFHIENKKIFDDMLLLFMETWSAFCMFWAWIIFRLEYAGVPTRITNFLLIIIGYGPLLCTINLAAYIAEIKRPNLKWDKTEKATSLRVIRSHPEHPRIYDFDVELAKDIRREYRFFCRELISLAAVGAIFLLLYYF